MAGIGEAYAGAVARLVGINHVALEVGDLEEALEFYGRLFEFELRGRVPGMAFLDMGDQFLALAEGRDGPPDPERHFGLVVDDREAVRRALREEDAEIIPRRKGSRSAIRGATRWRSCSTPTFSSPSPLRSSPRWGSPAWASPRPPRAALAELRDKGLLG